MSESLSDIEMLAYIQANVSFYQNSKAYWMPHQTMFPYMYQIVIMPVPESPVSELASINKPISMVRLLSASDHIIR